MEEKMPCPRPIAQENDLSTSVLARRPARSVRKVRAKIEHPSFEDPQASQMYGGNPGDFKPVELSSHLDDDTTCELARRMHYAAWRAKQESSAEEQRLWERRSQRWRDLIVMGNIKLVYRAVRRWRVAPQWLDDQVGECQIVLIRAVASFNPWVGIRFSTYAFTCLVRSLSRQTHRRAADKLSRAVPLDAVAGGEPRELSSPEPSPAAANRLEEFFLADHPLLSQREKLVLSRRFQVVTGEDGCTLEQVGRELGVSKERVRQLQQSGLGKLRKVLAGAANMC